MSEKKIVIHKVANALPEMDEKTFKETLEDVRARGFEQPIDYVPGKEAGTVAVIDGRHRLKICRALKIDPWKTKTISGEPLMRKYHDTDSNAIVQHVISINLRRRHLNASQRAAAAANLVPMISAELKKNQQEAGRKTAAKRGKDAEPSDSGHAETGKKQRAKPARAIASEMTGAKERLTGHALFIKKHSPELFAKVEKGEITAMEAVALIKGKKQKASIAEAAAAAPPPSLDNQRIVTGDCISEMDKMDAKSVNLVIADSPYNIGIDYGKGERADRKPPDEFRGWCRAWITKCAELLSPTGSMFLVINDENVADFDIIARGAGLHRRAWIVWYETFGQNMRDNFNRCHRHILYYVKNPKTFTFNHDAVKRASDRLAKYNDKRANPHGKIWDDVWCIPRLVGNAEERIKGVPTQLPLALVQPLVDFASNPGDLVLDPFAGSGTSIVAAALGAHGPRKAIGIELNPDFAKIASDRVKLTLAGMEKKAKKKAKAKAAA